MKNIGNKLADLMNPTFSSISVGSVIYDVVKDGKGLGIRTLRCILVNGAEVTVSTLDSSTTIRYYQSLFNKQFFLSYNKALEALHEAEHVCISISKPQMMNLAKKYIGICERSDKEKNAELLAQVQEELNSFIEYVYETMKK